MAVHLPPRQAPLLPPPPSKEYLEENLAPRMLAVDGTIFGMAMLCVVLRIYVRVVMLKTFGIDGMCLSPLMFFRFADFDLSDWLMMLAAVCTISTRYDHYVATHSQSLTAPDIRY
jgi:hypothetical protein